MKNLQWSKLSLVEVYSDNLLETTPMNEVQCRNLTYRNVKNRKYKNWNEICKVRLVSWIWVWGHFLGSSLLFILLKDDHRISHQTVELLLRGRWSCYLISSSTMPSLAVRLPSYIWIWMWVTVEATSSCISLLIHCYLDLLTTNINYHVYYQDRRLEWSSHITLTLPRVEL